MRTNCQITHDGGHDPRREISLYDEPLVSPGGAVHSQGRGRKRFNGDEALSVVEQFA
jgi:hypothetical protein